MTSSRDLRFTFDRAATRYHRARPRYPESLLDALLATTGLGHGSSVVEVGPASGVASEQLADRGLSLTCIEPGPALAEQARRNLDRFPNVEVIGDRFETWAKSAGEFDAVVAATSWHWIDPDIKYRLAHDVLRPGGWLAFWSANHVFPEGGDTIFEQLQPVYDQIGAAKSDGWVFRRPGELDVTEFADEDPFEMVRVEHFDWEIAYTAERYIDLLCTFSDHIAMVDDERERLFDEVRRLMSSRPDGLLRRHWGAVLHIARAI